MHPKQAHRQNQRRIHYRRLTPEQMREGMDTVGLSIVRFALITGWREDRIRKMLAGVEDIPPVMATLLALLTLPGAVALAERAALHQVSGTTDLELR